MYGCLIYTFVLMKNVGLVIIISNDGFHFCDVDSEVSPYATFSLSDHRNKVEMKTFSPRLSAVEVATELWTPVIVSETNVAYDVTTVIINISSCWIIKNLWNQSEGRTCNQCGLQKLCSTITCIKRLVIYVIRTSTNNQLINIFTLIL